MPDCHSRRALSRMRPPDRSLPRALTRLLPMLVACALFIGCTVTLIGDYDDVLDKGITDLQQTAETYFAKLLSTPETPYDQSFHDGIHARLAVLTSRAASLPKYTIISQQLDNLTMQFGNFQQLDHEAKRPVPPAVVNGSESAINTSIEAIVKLEIALKRTGNPPSGTTTTPPSK